MRLSPLVLATAMSTAIPALAQAQAISVQGPSGPSFALSAETIARMPSLHLETDYETEHGLRHASFDGPLLWTVLAAAHAVNSAMPREAVRQIVILTGSDGYTAVLALGEISPAFENKTVILANRMNGKALSDGHLHLAMPGDRHGGRDVRDVISIKVTDVKP